MVAATGPAPGSELTAEADEVEERSSAGVLHVAAIFASHMVLQRNKPNAVFGALDADCAGMEVVAQIRDFDGSMVAQAHAYASKDLKDGLSPWRVMLPAQPEGGPYTLRVTAGNDFLEFEDVLIGEWRAIWSENLPFLIVQLPQWIDKKVDETEGDPMLWPVLREAQWDAAQSIDNVYVICTIDCGEYDNIHPVDKRTPGERLADCALRQVYGMSRIPVYGPTVLGFRCDPNGRVRLFFRYAHGLHFDGTTPGSRNQGSDAEPPSLVRSPESSGFELAGADGVFHPATAAIFVDCDIDDLVNSKVNVVDYNATEFGIPVNSRSIGTITLACPDVPEPMSMRYAWRSWGPAPLFNSDGLPAQPFRLDLTDHTASNDDGE